MISGEELVNTLEVDRSNQEALERLEAAAVQYLERQTGRYFGGAATDTFVLKGWGKDRLWLPEPPTSSIASVTERSYAGGDAVTITGSDDIGFELRTLGTEAYLQRKLGGVWTRGYEYTVANMPYGYASGSEPTDIREQVVNIVNVWWEMRAQGSGALRSVTEGRVIRTLASGNLLEIVPGLRETVFAWRRRHF